jgi:hypothetical protein
MRFHIPLSVLLFSFAACGTSEPTLEADAGSDAGLCLGIGDSDADGVCDDDDSCVGDDATGDADDDGTCDDEDSCVGDDATGDADDDGVCDDEDFCLGDDSSGDSDANGVCDLTETLLRSPWASVDVAGTAEGGGMPLVVADVDGDGDLDWVSTHHNARRIVLWSNAGDGAIAESQAFNSGHKAKWIDVFDLEGDGDLDLVHGGLDRLQVVRNSGSALDTANRITLGNAHYAHVLTMRVDGDDLDDIVAFDTANGEFEVALNDDDEGPGEPQVFDTVSDDQFLGPGMASLLVNDDAFADLVVSTSNTSASLGWYPNDGEGSFDAYVEITDAGLGSDLQVVDVDGDALLDIVGIDGGVSWHRNEGEGVFAARAVLLEGTWDLCRVTDVDGDGRMDLVVGDQNPAIVAWSEQAENGTFGVPHTIAETDPRGVLEVGDFDGDLDVDVVRADSELTGFVWHPNPLR